jgi:magnesium chelatase family protein
VLRVAWTVADLAGRAAPGAAELRTALALRRGYPSGVRGFGGSL